MISYRMQDLDKAFKKQRIGIYGGSFNPIHIGHLKTADYLIENGYLDEVRFLLNPCSPFKKNSRMPDAFHRAKCILATLSDNVAQGELSYGFNIHKHKMKLDTTEMQQSINHKVCYTVNTLKDILYKNVETNNEYYLIMGADVFNTIKKFKKWRWFF